MQEQLIPVCKEDDCGDVVYAKGFCLRCYHKDYQRRNRDRINRVGREWSRRNAEKSQETKRRYREKVTGPSRRIPMAVQDELFARGRRLCVSCGQELPLASFSRQRSRRHGYTSQCKACHTEYLRTWREANYARVREVEKAKHPRTAREQKRAKFRYKYGIELEEYEAMLADQSYACAICYAPLEDGRADTHLDHCHASGQVRGVLCRGCNIGLGAFRDNQEFLRKAVEYLQKTGMKLWDKSA